MLEAILTMLRVLTGVLLDVLALFIGTPDPSGYWLYGFAVGLPAGIALTFIIMYRPARSAMRQADSLTRRAESILNRANNL